MNSTINPPRVIYFHNLMTLLVDCRSGNPNRWIPCVTSSIVGAVSAYLLPVILILGILGNALVAYVTLIRTQPLSRQNAYFGCIAIADAVTMNVEGWLNVFASRGLPWLSGGRRGFILQNQGTVGCKLFYLTNSLCPLMPVALMLTMVTDRALSLTFPFKFRSVGPSFALKCMASAGVFSILLALPPAVLVELDRFKDPASNNTIVACYFRGQSIGPVLYWNLTCNPPTILLALVLLLNIALFLSVIRAIEARRHSLTGGDAARLGELHLSGATTVLTLSMATLATHVPVVAMHWTIRTFGSTSDAAKMSGTVRILINMLTVLKTFTLISQACNLPILLHRSSNFRQATLQLFLAARGPAAVQQPEQRQDPSAAVEEVQSAETRQ